MAATVAVAMVVTAAVIGDKDCCTYSYLIKTSIALPPMGGE